MKYIDNKNNTTNKVISIILLLLITIGVSFSYFSANISGEETGTTTTVTGGTMNINYASGSSINIANVYPKEEALTTKTITYLSKTNYGADKEKIWNNAYNGNVTGCSGSIVNAINESTCLTYETPNGQKASTTYNIYGVYDMSGGALEFVMGNYDNVISGSGFDEISSIVSKYIDRYSGEGSYDKIIYGDAVYEISSLISGSTSWFGEYSCIPSASNPWFARGGGWGSGSVAGPFGFYYDSGNSVYGGGFRVVLMTTS